MYHRNQFTALVGQELVDKILSREALTAEEALIVRKACNRLGVKCNYNTLKNYLNN